MGETSIRPGPVTAETIRPLLDFGPRVVVVTLGARGAIALTATETATQSAFPVEMVDATGAGDCFNAAFLVASQDTKSLAYSLEFACAAAALSVTSAGARAGLPNSENVRRLMSGKNPS